MALTTLRLNLGDTTGPGRVGEILIRPLSSSNDTSIWTSTKAARLPLKYSDPLHASTDPAYAPEYTLLDGTKYPQVTQGAFYEFTVVRVNSTKDGSVFTAQIPASASVDFDDLAPVPAPPSPDLTDTAVAYYIASGSLSGSALATKIAAVGSTKFASIVNLTGSAATDTPVVQAAIDAGGQILLRYPAHTSFKINGLLMKSNAHLDLGGLRMMLNDGANTDLITVPNFGTLTGSNGSGGETEWSIRNGILDGNGSAQSGTSWTLRVYGYNFSWDKVVFQAGLTGNIYSEWGNAGTGNMESRLSNYKVLAPVATGGYGILWKGPHDSQHSNGVIVARGGAGPSGVTGQIGLEISGNAGGEMFTNFHVWGSHAVGVRAINTIIAKNFYTEGAYTSNLDLLGNGNHRFDGIVHGTGGGNPTEIGVRMGNSSYASVRGNLLNIKTYNWGADATPIDWTYSGGKNRVTGVAILGSATLTPPPNTMDDMQIMVADNGTDVDTSTERIGHPLRIMSGSNAALRVGRFQVNTNSNRTDLNFGMMLRGWKDDFGTSTWEADGLTGYVRPGTTAGMGARIFSGTGDPNGVYTGTAGDVYLRSDVPSSGAVTLYQSVGGTAWAHATQDPGLLATGEATINRYFATTSAAASSGSMVLTYFTARKSETTANVRTISGGTAAATPTLCRVGLYTVSSGGDLTLVASTTNDTTLWAATNTAYTKAWASSYAKVAGQKYALGMLFVGTTPPKWMASVPLVGSEMGQTPRLSGTVTGQTDLPSSVTSGSIGNSAGFCAYAAIIP